MDTIADLSPEYRHLTYAQAEYMYMNGTMSADQWELYCYIWRNSAYRYSSIAIAYQNQEYQGANNYGNVNTRSND